MVSREARSYGAPYGRTWNQKLRSRSMKLGDMICLINFEIHLSIFVIL